MENRDRYRAATFPEGTQFIFAHKSGDGGFYSCSYKPDVAYAQRGDYTLDLQLILPQASHKVPAVIYVMGGGWRKQDVYSSIPTLSLLASRGFAVASVRYRETERAIFPAFLEDVKTAVRFLRSKADEYNIDSDHIGIWGGSSGGHTAAMMGLTGGLYKTEDYPEFSDSVQAVADFYGPAEFLRMNDCSAMDHNAPDSPESLLIGGPLPENRKLSELASPTCIVKDAKDVPPFLIVHGDTDEKVHFYQSADLYTELRKYGHNAMLVCVRNASHGTGIMGPGCLDILTDFFRTYLQEPGISR